VNATSSPATQQPHGEATKEWRRTPVGATDVLVGALLLALVLGWLGAGPLFDVDEGAFAEASREMLASGDWGHTTLNGADRFDKPILVYWLQAAALALAGPHEWAARLPSALCAWVWALATWVFVAPRWGAAAGRLAACVLLTSLGPLMIGRAATADALLNMLLALTVFDAWRFLEVASSEGVDEARERGARFALRRCFLWAGLGVLTKGPVALVVPAGAALLWAGLRGRAWRAVGRALADVPAWAILLVVAVPWYAYALQRHGWAFVDGFLVRHNLERFAGPLQGHAGGPLYYVLMLPVLMWPWWPLLVPLARGWRPLLADEASRLLLAWAAFVWVFFSLSGTKLPHYALYGYTPLAVLEACWLARQRQFASAAVAVAVACVVLVGAGAASALLAPAAAARFGDTHWRAVLDAVTLPAGPPLGGAALAIALIFAAAVWGWRRAALAPSALAAAALVSAAWTTIEVLPWWARALQGPVKTLALEATARGLPLVQWQLHQPSVGFYRRAPTPRRAPRPGEAALTRLDRFERTGRAEVPAAEIAHQERGFALVVVPPEGAR
jgi:4-amino-4-deoxy-L-arabinose transferase-like glycosyltransferase